MQKEINIEKESVVGDAKMVHTLSRQRGLNNGKGYSVSLVNMVKLGSRNNNEVSALFIEVIQNRNQLLR